MLWRMSANKRAPGRPPLVEPMDPGLVIALFRAREAGMSLRAIAADLGVSLKAVRYHLDRWEDALTGSWS